MRGDVTVQLLRGALSAAEGVRANLRLAQSLKDPAAISEEAQTLLDILADTINIARTEGLPSPIMDGSTHRRSPSDWTSEEMIETIRLAKQIDGVAIEALLKDKPDLSLEDQDALLAQAHELIQVLARRITLTKRLLAERWPGTWGPELDQEFADLLRVRPRGRPKN